MRIALLTGCLEPERDGVGDYTRLLAEACRKRGHEIKTFALRDAFAKNGSAAEGRFADALDNAESRDGLIRQLKAFSPDWVSLQLVLYALHPKGLPNQLPALLRACRGPWRWQVMFHEIWIGCKVGVPLKEKLIGLLQRQLIRKCLKQIEPDLIHTQALPYRELLRRQGWPAELLPLFGNIDVLWPGDAPSAAREAAAPDTLDKFHVGGIFGTLHPEWPAEPLLSQLREAGQAAGKPVLLLHFGGIGPGKAMWESLMQHNDEHLRLAMLGRLSAAQASQLMHGLDFGVATSPRALIEKSGSATAMLEHGLPVLINRDDVRYPGLANDFPLPDEQLIDFRGRLPDNFFTLPKREPMWRLDAVAEQFLKTLET